METSTYKKIILEDLKDRGEPWKPSFKFDQKIYGKSFDEVDFQGYDGYTLIRGYYQAYEEHCPIYLSPDIIWLLIVQAFASHINFNAEKLRKLFVNFEGQKTLKVNLSEFTLDQISNQTFANSFKNFSQQIEEFIGKEKKELFDFNFSTTTETIKTVGYASLMCGMQKYFKYEMHCCGCGIPFIALDGTLDDWKKIKENLLKLKQFGLEEWIDIISERIEKIISEISADKPDVEFWKNFIRKGLTQENRPSGRGYRNVEAIEGWLFEFYPYNPKGEERIDYLDYPVNPRKISDEFTQDILVTPVKVIEDTTGKSYDLQLRSGFLGMQKGEDSLVKPVIGWFISEKS